MLRSHFTALILITFLFAACKKSSSSGSTTTTGSSGFTAVINGNAWSATTYAAVIETDINTGAHAISITGAATLPGKIQSINLYINNYTGVTGALAISDGGDNTGTYLLGSQVNHGSTGTVTISSTTGGISGTFSFVADSMNITSGTFTNVPIH